MFQNYLKIALRTLWRDKAYSVINIAGLSLGITCAILIFILVQHQLSYDTYHKKAERTYRVVMDLHFGSLIQTPGVPYPFPPALRQDFTEAEKIAAYWEVPNVLVSFTGKNGKKEKFQEESVVSFAEPEFFEIFDYQWLKGDHKVLSNPDKVVVTRQIAEKYFGKEDPIGKTIRLDNEKDYVIAGLLADIPENTSHRSEIFLPYVAGVAQMSKEDQGHWGGVSSNHRTYVVLPEKMSQSQL
ncbi:MAG: ABC transporter permease [Saprospiraceae bacterium]